ncbi:MAG: hypothetical protein ACRD52_07250 [Candidatus Acidiferrales bacterium]
MDKLMRKKCPSCGSLVRVTIRHIENYKLVREYCHHCGEHAKAGLPVPEIQHKRAEEPQDTVLELMKKHNVPLTRQNYLDIAYWGNPPEDTGGEIEAEIPWEIKHAGDIALMAQMGVRWVPDSDDDED